MAQAARGCQGLRSPLGGTAAAELLSLSSGVICALCHSTWSVAEGCQPPGRRGSIGAALRAPARLPGAEHGGRGDGPRRCPKAPRNGKPPSCRGPEGTPWRQQRGRRAGPTTAELSGLRLGRTMPPEVAPKGSPVASGVGGPLRAWDAWAGEGCDPEGHRQPATQESEGPCAGTEGPWHFFWPKAVRQRWAAAAGARGPAVCPRCLRAPCREPGCPWSTGLPAIWATQRRARCQGRARDLWPSSAAWAPGRTSDLRLAARRTS